MNHPFLASKYRCLFPMACVLLASGAISARAADQLPTVTLSVKTIEGDPTVTQGTPSTDAAPGATVVTVVGATGALRVNSPLVGNSSTTTSSGATTTQAKVYLELTIQNLDQAIAAPQLEVRWHLYTKTTTVGKNSSNTTMKDVSGSKTLPPLAPQAKTAFDSDPIDKNVSSSTSTTQHSVTTVAVQGSTIVGASTNPVSSETTGTSSITILDGYYVEIVYNGAVIRHTPTDEKSKYEEYLKAHGGK